MQKIIDGQSMHGGLEFYLTSADISVAFRHKN